MHEELYISENSKIRFLMLTVGILLLPFSFFCFAVIDGKPDLSFQLDIPLLFTGVLFIVVFFEKQFSTLMRFGYPFIALLICEFCRFGTVSLFDRVISFEYYIVSAAFMGCAFGFTFILYFVAIGKMRTRLPLFAFSALNLIVAIVSPILRIIPFVAYDDTVSGRKFFSISYLVAFLIINGAALGITLALRDDKAKEERRQKRLQKKEDRYR